MTLLRHISYDVLRGICDLLPLEAILTLYDTNDRAIIRALCNCMVVPSVDVVQEPTPLLRRFLASHFNLLSFSFNRSWVEPDQDRYQWNFPHRTNLCPISTRLLSSLKCRNLGSLILVGSMPPMAEAAQYSQTFAELFPSLHTLVLRGPTVNPMSGNVDNGPMSSLVRRLPQKLHTLVLDACWVLGPPVEALPASLTSLSLLEPRTILLYAYGEHVSSTGSMLSLHMHHTKPALHALRVVMPRLPRLASLEIRLSSKSLLLGQGFAAAPVTPDVLPPMFGGPPPTPQTAFGSSSNSSPSPSAPSTSSITSITFPKEVQDPLEHILPPNTPPLAFPSTLESLLIIAMTNSQRELAPILNAAPSICSLVFRGHLPQLSPTQLNWTVPRSLTSLELVSEGAQDNSGPNGFSAPAELLRACAHVSELRLANDPYAKRSFSAPTLTTPSSVEESEKLVEGWLSLIPRNLKFLKLYNISMIPQVPLDARNSAASLTSSRDRIANTPTTGPMDIDASREKEEVKPTKKRQLAPLMSSVKPIAVQFPPNLVSIKVNSIYQSDFRGTACISAWELRLPSTLTSYHCTSTQLDISDIDRLPETLTSINTALTDEWRQTEVKRLVSKLKNNLKIFASNSPVWFVIDKDNIPKDSDLLKTDTFSLYDHWMAEMRGISHLLKLSWHMCPVESVCDKSESADIDPGAIAIQKFDLKFASNPPHYIHFVFDIERFPSNIRMSPPTDETIRGLITYGRSTGLEVSFVRSETEKLEVSKVVPATASQSTFGAPVPLFSFGPPVPKVPLTRVYALDDGSTDESCAQSLIFSKTVSSSRARLNAAASEYKLAHTECFISFPMWIGSLAPNLTKLDFNSIQLPESLDGIEHRLPPNLVSLVTQPLLRTPKSNMEELRYRYDRDQALVSSSMIKTADNIQFQGFGNMNNLTGGQNASLMASKFPPLLTRLCIDAAHLTPPAAGTASQYWPRGLTELRFTSYSWTDADVLETIEALPELSSLVIFGQVVLDFAPEMRAVQSMFSFNDPLATSFTSYGGSNSSNFSTKSEFTFGSNFPTTSAAPSGGFTFGSNTSSTFGAASSFGSGTGGFSFGSATSAASPSFGSAPISTATTTPSGGFATMPSSPAAPSKEQKKRRSILPLKSSTVVLYDLRNELCRLLHPANIESFLFKGKLSHLVVAESVKTLILSPSFSDRAAALKKGFQQLPSQKDVFFNPIEVAKAGLFPAPSPRKKIWIEKEYSGKKSSQISKIHPENNQNSGEINEEVSELEEFYVCRIPGGFGDWAKGKQKTATHALYENYAFDRPRPSQAGDFGISQPLYLRVDLDFHSHASKYESLRRLEIGQSVTYMTMVKLLPANLTHLSIILASDDPLMDIFSSFPRKLTTLVIDSERAIGMSEEGCAALPQGLEKFLCNRLSFSPTLSSQLPARLSNFMFNADEQWSDLDILELSQKHLFRGENNEIEKLVVYNATISGSFVNVANGSESDCSIVKIDYLDMTRSSNKALGEKVFCTWSGLSPMFKLPEGNTSESTNSSNFESSMQIDSSTNVVQKPVFLDLRLATFNVPISEALAPLPHYVTQLALRSAVKLTGQEMKRAFGKSRVEKLELEFTTPNSVDLVFFSYLPRKLKHLKMTFVFEGPTYDTSVSNQNCAAGFTQMATCRPFASTSSIWMVLKALPVVLKTLSGLPTEELETLEIPHFHLHGPCMRYFGQKLRLLHVYRLNGPETLNFGRQNNPIQLIQTIDGRPSSFDPPVPRATLGTTPYNGPIFSFGLTASIGEDWGL